MILIVDSWAWLASGEEGRIADRCLKYLNDKNNGIFTTVLNLYEIYYRVRDGYGEEQAAEFIESVKNRATVMDIDSDLALAASKVHIREKLPAIDSFVYAASLKLNAKILTGDPHFKGKENVIFIE